MQRCCKRPSFEYACRVAPPPRTVTPRPTPQVVHEGGERGPRERDAVQQPGGELLGAEHARGGAGGRGQVHPAEAPVGEGPLPPRHRPRQARQVGTPWGEGGGLEGPAAIWPHAPCTGTPLAQVPRGVPRAATCHISPFTSSCCASTEVEGEGGAEAMPQRGCLRYRRGRVRVIKSPVSSPNRLSIVIGYLRSCWEIDGLCELHG